MGVSASCEKGGGRVWSGRSVGGFGGGEIGGTEAGSAIMAAVRELQCLSLKPSYFLGSVTCEQDI